MKFNKYFNDWFLNKILFDYLLLESKNNRKNSRVLNLNIS